MHNDGQGCGSQFRQCFSDSGKQGGNNADADLQKYRKAGEQCLTKHRKNGGQFFHQNLHQSRNTFCKGFCSPSCPVQNPLQPFTHQSDKGKHGGKHIRRHCFQGGHNGFCNSTKLGIGVGKQSLRPLCVHHIAIKFFVILGGFLIQTV